MSQRAGGQGLDDIWRASASGTNFGITPVTELNTSSNEIAPYLTGDGLTAFWSTDRATSPGGRLEIWSAHRATMSSPFVGLAPVQELNTTYGEVMGSVSPDGCRIYFASSRPGVGGNDIYVAERPKSADSSKLAWRTDGTSADGRALR